ncbi:probable ubiquitin carboxyl-terminal hydrolase MINDY-4 isoform X1 [Zalophus californianus]|uniref:Ubiquitin carboxyl-terminal hydrolase MINDY n=2 Tax=Zalophus californianus TaxID=9704 RepID=A0A6J2BF90_ZALCA|nr:probable ubiquitin carboxyl-terminal hydrolase MINDY-4 isoform X1 [Zalophus californianus]XP_027430589.1 probable ubiquitin carboxyl-terminal hydrolase MINDY-4 isoform X1 [Zalophus californianus]
MDSLFVEEVAASLVREFLSRKGLKKTCVTMDQERPRSDLSINSRSDLRKVLHLEFLYKENKAKENPLKTNLELITRYFLDYFGNTTNNFTQETPIPALSIPKKNNKLPSRCSETTLVNIYDLADEDAGWRTSLSETSKARHSNLDGDLLGNFVSSKRPPSKSQPTRAIPGESPAAAPAWEKMDKLQSSEISLDTKGVGEKVRPKSGLIVRGMMAGPVASSPQDSLRKRSLRRSPALSSTTQAPEEESRKVPGLSTRAPACPKAQEGLASGTGSPSRSPLGLLSELTSEKRRTTPGSPPHLSGKGLLQRVSGRWRDLTEESPAADSGPEANGTPLKFSFPGGSARPAQERLERTFTRQGSQPLPLRKNQLPVPNKADGELGVLQLEDVEDELIKDEVILSPGPSMLKLQIVSKPVDLSVAKDIKALLFGSSFCCFNEEWKLQSFSFNDKASLKYGIVQNKGGPCGVLAAVQGCVLQKLLFEGDSKADCVRQLQPSNARRTHCLALAIADIVWRAGGHKRAVVTLASGTQQFSPTGKYKADGVLETLTLHSLTCYEELVTFLQESIHQPSELWDQLFEAPEKATEDLLFEAGPYGCILLTLSAILSRSTELVRQDFDVPTSHLIGAHGYCTQELVNLLLTGKAVSNVFNDVVELDSGNGNITLLKGIAARSDVGFLSLFEHYNVCQVGCFLKTPRFPIWVVCSESHFSVLFSLQPELLQDWRAERLFDLYYYDGLANQQEQIRLSVDTTQTIPEDRDNELIPPLELCIRTRWKGAAVNWNGSDPIL